MLYLLVLYLYFTRLARLPALPYSSPTPALKEKEATANVAWASVIGTLGFIGMSYTIYLKKKQDYIWGLQKAHIKNRRDFVLAKDTDEASLKDPDEASLKDPVGGGSTEGLGLGWAR